MDGAFSGNNSKGLQAHGVRSSSAAKVLLKCRVLMRQPMVMGLAVVIGMLTMLQQLSNRTEGLYGECSLLAADKVTLLGLGLLWLFA